MTTQAQAMAEPALRPALELVLLRFRLRARRRTAWLRHLRAEEVELAGSSAAVHGEMDAILADRDSPQAEADWLEAEPWSADWSAELRAVEEARAVDTTSRLARLRQIFGLSREESDLLEACLAVALDPSLARLCAYLQDHTGRAYMTDILAARFYGHLPCGVFSGESALSRWEMILARDVGAGEPSALTCDPQLRDWLAGIDLLPEALVGIAQLIEPQPPPASWPVQETVELIHRHINGEAAGRTCITVSGARGSGRRTFAAAVAAEFRLPALAVDADQIPDPEWRRTYVLTQRHAYLERSALVWFGESAARRTWPTVVPPFPLQFVIAEPVLEPHPCAGVVEHRVRMPGLTASERSELWRHYLPASEQWPAADFHALVQRYRVLVGDIAAVAQHGAASADEAGRRVREAARGRLGNLAQLLGCPFQWDDLVVPASLREALEDIVFEANHRVAFWEQTEAQRLFPQGQGLMALFSGPPGTGKTMAAQVMAATLGYDLFRVDLAGVVSKWVGETSQNFERILTRAADMQAMILFDECDAVFTKRTSEVRDAQDKFANTDAAYLLQAIESYPGIALLATNQKGNIDPAFIRRLRYVLEFVKPDAPQRLEIWRKVVRGLAGEDRAAALGGCLESLAEAIDATGAQIKFAVLGALFVAQREGAPLAARHLLRGLERELAKEGRGLSARDRERILSHAR
jgi:adenylate kinase family enzyme